TEEGPPHHPGNRSCGNYERDYFRAHPGEPLTSQQSETFDTKPPPQIEKSLAEVGRQTKEANLAGVECIRQNDVEILRSASFSGAALPPIVVTPAGSNHRIKSGKRAYDQRGRQPQSVANQYRRHCHDCDGVLNQTSAAFQ